MAVIQPLTFWPTTLWRSHQCSLHWLQTLCRSSKNLTTFRPGSNVSFATTLVPKRIDWVVMFEMCTTKRSPLDAPNAMLLLVAKTRWSDTWPPCIALKGLLNVTFAITALDERTRFENTFKVCIWRMLNPKRSIRKRAKSPQMLPLAMLLRVKCNKFWACLNILYQGMKFFTISNLINWIIRDFIQSTRTDLSLWLRLQCLSCQALLLLWPMLCMTTCMSSLFHLWLQQLQSWQCRITNPFTNLWPKIIFFFISVMISKLFFLKKKCATNATSFNDGLVSWSKNDLLSRRY